MNWHSQWLFETPDFMATQPKKSRYQRGKESGGVLTGGIEPILRRKKRYPYLPDDFPVDERIPLGGAVDCGLENTSYPTRYEAHKAALAAANKLGSGYEVVFEGRHRKEELPHFHITTPDRKRCKGHFYYGRKPYYAPKRTPPIESVAARKAKRKFQQESEYTNQWLFEAPVITVPAPARNYNDESEWNWNSNGCRKVTSTPCPGQKGQFTQIDYFPSMFLVNRGTCPLFIASLLNGRPTNIAHLELQPGESAFFKPHKGSNGVAFACHMDCQGNGLLEHPYLCA
jgi:hypothetical protein